MNKNNPIGENLNVNFKTPSGWKWYRFGDIFEFKNGVNADKESYGDGIKFINVLDVLNNTYITSSKIIGSVTLDKSDIISNVVKRGDILFNRTSETPGDIGLTSVYLDDEVVVFGGFVIRGRPRNNILDDNYKKYCFNSSYLRKQIVASGQGAIRSNVGQSDLEKVWLLVPPENEQRMIASTISVWDGAIESTKVLIEQKKLYKNALMQQLLTGTIRLPGFRKSWKELKSSNIFESRNELRLNNGGYPLYSLTIENGVTPKSARYNREFLVRDKDVKKYKVVYPNDIVFNPANLRWGAINRHSRDFKVLVSPIYETMSIKKDFDIGFITHLVTSPRQVSYYASIVEGTLIERMAVKADTFLSCVLKIPELDEQKAIASILDSASLEINLLKSKHEYLVQQKRGLMQKLLIGKIRVIKEG